MDPDIASLCLLTGKSLALDMDFPPLFWFAIGHFKYSL